MIKKNIGWLTVIFLAVIPIVRWFFVEPFGLRFINLNQTATSFGQIAGLLGMILFALNLIISSRTKFIDRIFFGLPDAYGIHHKIGAISFCLLLFHPLFLVIKYFNFSLRESALFFVPQGVDAISWGIYALALMIILLGITFYVKIKYHIWKLSHKFMVLVFVFAIMHNLLIESDISRDAILRYYIFSFAFLGLVLSFYQAFLSKIIHKNFECRVKNIVLLNENIVQIELKGNKKLNFFSGQFVFVRFLGQGVTSESHPFTISSSPKENNLKFATKNLGDFTAKLKNIKIGDKVLLQGPFGKFNFKNAELESQIWIAGGIGITPFLSMARSLEKENAQRIDLYYCVKNEKEAVLSEDLVNISKENKNFRVVLWYSDQKGFVTAEKISELSRGVTGKEIFLCGPLGFMQSLRAQFLKQGVKNKNIHWENFSFL